ncbi:MAG: glycosyltransferase family 2 protein [Lachnospiraceae bacterium]|nr:glycosyltransferase family 2 protein [Lachnospiraceae bacterium]
MIYAPVIIPTLNRIEHLKDCLTSLERNKFADKTDVFIALDCPPSEKYVEGYEKVREYLETAKFGFASLTVVKREINYGPIDNGSKLIDEVFEKYDRCIFSEDDNIFAPTFLEFMNECLEKYADNEDILAVYGFRPRIKNTYSEGNKVIKVNYFSAYGCGLWRDKHRDMVRNVNRQYIEDLCCNKGKMKRIAEVCPEGICYLASILLRKEKLYQTPDGRVQLIDTVRIIHAIAENKYLLCSPIRLILNNGYDGSGAHCSVSVNKFASASLDDHEQECIVKVCDEPEFRELDFKLQKNRIIPYISAILRIKIWRIIAKRKVIG